MPRFPSLALIPLALVLFAPSARAEEGAVQRFGVKITVKKPVDLAALARTPEKFKGRTVRLEGTVRAVCQGRGCWIEVEDGRGASFLARSLDEKVLVPRNCKGRRVVVQGRVTTLPAAAAADSSADHACPKPEWVVATQGVELSAAEAK